MMIAIIIHIIFSPHINNPITIVGVIVNELVAKYFVIAYVFANYQKNNDLRSFVRIAYLSLLLISFVGMINLILHIDPLKIFSTSDLGESFINHRSRQRAISLFVYPFDYGYTSLMLLLFMLYAKLNGYIYGKKFFIAIICAIFGIFFCGCRTVLVTSIVSVGCFLLFHYSFFKVGWYVIVAATVLFTLYTFSPKFQNTVDITLMAFDPDAKMERGGSSTLKDRSIQYLTTYEYARKNIWTGRGYRFFENDLGYNKNGGGLSTLKGKAKNLLGLEGVMMRLLLEQGLIGIASYIIFYFMLIRFAVLLKKRSPLDSAFAISTLVAIICFGNLTGELGSPIITFLFTGMYLKAAFTNKELLEKGGSDMTGSIKTIKHIHSTT